MQIKTTPSFLRQANKLFRKNKKLKEQFKQTVEKLLANPFGQSLKTHKLAGDLKDFWSCSVTHKIRLRFKLANSTIELIDIGTHDEGLLVRKCHYF